MLDVALINRSSVWTDQAAAACMKALQVQVSRDFAPVWAVDCKLTLIGQGAAPAADTWWLVLLDNSDDASALGYHELTNAGLPIGKCFLKTTLIDHGLPSVVVSHELLEMLADPWISDLVLDNHHGRRQRMYAREVADACEDDQFAYDIDGVTVSDFVYPSWFQAWRVPGSTQFDHQSKITAPFQLLSGGYISYQDIHGGGWQQETAELVHHTQYRAQVGTRRERRRLGKNFWRQSIAHKGA